ncbi:hypothetical protein BSKO_09972 [Bryopsis sp. KO-2023]|nr:hypothetical protein BSKO_09972 [Bryopsis sp. KO-2023]
MIERGFGSLWRSGGQLGLPSSSRVQSRCDAFVARSHTRNQADAVGKKKRHGGTYERILRYPNGDTRRIRYPVDESEEEPEGDLRVDDLFWVTSDSIDESVVEAASSTTTTDEPKRHTELPTSPAELIRYLNSEGYREAQRNLRKKIKGSYQIMEGCPWVRSRSLYLVAIKNREGREDPLTYTLPTRVERRSTAQELSKLLKSSNGRDDIFDVGEVLDGVISFEDRDDGERFRANLEAEGYSEATLCEVDAHELFRNTREAKAVVVLMDCQEYLPYPLELGTSLRGHTSLEDWGS